MNNKKPTISVIMGVYNSNNKNLRKAIDSILKQSYSNFEFIICDDGSIDGTYEVIEKEYSGDERIILIKNDNNCGLAYSLNHCINKASGIYIARMDADDVSLIDRFEKETKFLNEHEEYSFVGCNVHYINDTGRWGEFVVPEIPTTRSFLFNNPFIHPTMMIRKKDLLAVEGYLVADITRRAEDYEIWMRMYSKGYKGYNIQEKLYEFREDVNAYKRRKFKYRLDEMVVRYIGFKSLHLYPIGLLFVLKPIFVGIIPQRLLARIRPIKNNKYIKKIFW